MRIAPLTTTVLLFFFAITLTSGGADKKKSNTNDVKRQQQDLQKAKDKLKEEEKEFGNAKTQASRANTTLDRATQAVAALRRQIQNEQMNAGPFLATRKQMDELKQKMEEVAKPVLESLRIEPGYRNAVAERDRLQKRIDNPMAGNAAGDIVTADRLAKELANANAAVRKLESEALSKVPEYQSLVSEKQRLEASLQDMAKQRESQLANDPRLKRAQEELSNAKKEAAEAQKKLRREDQQKSAAQQKVRSEENEKRAMEQRKQEAERKKRAPKNK